APRAATTTGPIAPNARTARRLGSAAASARASRASTRESDPTGFSRRSHAIATTMSAGMLTRIVRSPLRTRRLGCACAVQNGRKIVASPNDGDRDACRLQAQEFWIRLARTAHEARRLDVDER